MLHRATNRADRLSGGEKQRVAIARAIAQEPFVILADEPVASLDPELSAQVLADLARVARDEGVPTMINIHAIELARAYCDRIVGIAQGVVVYDGSIGGLDEATMDRIYRFDRPVPACHALGERGRTRAGGSAGLMAVFARPFGRVVETQDAYRERLLRPLPRPTIKATILILLGIAALLLERPGHAGLARPS